MNPIVAYVTGNAFEKVIGQNDSHMKDFWFAWPDDYEPIRIIYENSKIASALHRRHWSHISVGSPYSNENNRIEAIFIWPGHTPMIRKARSDLSFYILIHSFQAQRLEDYVIIDEDVPDYYKDSGWKDRHFPPVQYDGWPKLK